MSALFAHAKSHEALAAELEEQAQHAALYPDEKAACVPDILHRMALAHQCAALALRELAAEEARQ